MQDCVLPTFDVLTDSQIQKINENSIDVKYKKGESICRQNHPIAHMLFLKSGLVKLTRYYSEDKSPIVGIVGPEKFLCLISVFYNKVYQTGGTALGESKVIYTNLEVFLDILYNNGKYAVAILRQISGSGYVMIERMIHISYTQVPGRMAGLLLYFSKESCRSNTFVIPFSRQEIAEFISTTKETVSRTLTEFKSDRLIELNGDLITLKSLDLIEKLSKVG